MNKAECTKLIYFPCETCFNINFLSRFVLQLPFSQGCTDRLTHEWCQTLNVWENQEQNKVHQFVPLTLMSLSFSQAEESDAGLWRFWWLPPPSLPPASWAEPAKMTVVDTGCWPKAISPLWPNSPQRCKHYMEEWPTDRPQRLQSEGQWLVQQPIRCVGMWVCVCQSRGECYWSGFERGGGGAVVNWTTQVLKRT